MRTTKIAILILVIALALYILIPSLSWAENGLPPAPELPRQRLIKEAIHEVGYTLNLAHRDAYSCVMSSSDAVERIDLKERSLCAICRGAAIADDAGFRPPGITEIVESGLRGNDVALPFDLS